MLRDAMANDAQVCCHVPLPGVTRVTRDMGTLTTRDTRPVTTLHTSAAGLFKPVPVLDIIYVDIQILDIWY